MAVQNCKARSMDGWTILELQLAALLPTAAIVVTIWSEVTIVFVWKMATGQVFVLGA